jgi:hypothetical protein
LLKGGSSSKKKPGHGFPARHDRPRGLNAAAGKLPYIENVPALAVGGKEDVIRRAPIQGGVCGQAQFL